MPFGLGPVEALWIGIVILGAAFVRGYSGFGFAALAVIVRWPISLPLSFITTNRWSSGLWNWR